MLNPGLKNFLGNKAGSLLVVGPPGTGKTYQLIGLIEHLIVNEKTEPGRILVFCFNRRWAKILRDATSESIHESILEIPITTFSAYCTDIVKKNQFINRLDSSGSGNHEIRILNAPEQWLLLKNTITRELDRKKYPVAFRHILNENKNVASSYIQEVFDFILRAQENLLAPSDLLEMLGKNTSPVLQEVNGIYACYKQKLLRENLYNYGRLLEDTVGFLKQNGDRKKTIQDSYDYIIVDDLQEVNKAQYEIVKAVSRGNCVFFGNDDQCIYAFRGSMISIFNEVYKNLDADSDGRNDVIFLDKNHRSSSRINTVNNLFISRNDYRLSKTSVADRSQKGTVSVKEFRNTIDEVDFIVDRIKDLISGNHVKPEEILVLVKGRGYKTRLLENMLESRSIAFYQRSSRALLDNHHVMYILNFFRLIILLRRYFKDGAVPGEGCAIIPEDETRKIDQLYETIIFSDFVGIKPSSQLGKNTRKKDIWEKLKVVPPLKEAVMDFIVLKEVNASETILKFLNDERIGIFKYLSVRNHLDEREKGTIISLIGDFLHTVRNFADKNPGANTISDYLSYLEDAMTNNFLEEIEDSTRESVRPGFVNIMSFHQCRGLEFDAVFLPFVNKNYLPSDFGSTQLYDMQTFNYFSGGKKIPDELLRKKHLEDERKLFYTGLTRARKFLSISSNIQEESSMFFEEIKAIRDAVAGKEKAAGRSIKAEKVAEDSGIASSGKQQGDHVYPGKNWLLRKSLVARNFKRSNNGRLNKKKFERDLVHLSVDYPCDGWWRTRKATKNRNKPAGVYSCVHSFSSLNTFKECPFRYKMKYFFNISEEENLGIVVGSLYRYSLL